ncbi:DUF1403 family protein [Mesorhizobium sp. SB112]|uniref:DUF1403 family protein n=1 Tax=Mesorhizobium sp. SB112 TaxID=3151853 RepID=UPI0032678A03
MDSRISIRTQIATVPSWAVPRSFVAAEADAAFMAGSALNTLDGLVRSERVWAGVWRQRLALTCAVSAMRSFGRVEDEAALRDAWVLRKPGDEPGPAGNILAAWKRAASRAPIIDAECIASFAELLGFHVDEALAELPAVADEITAEGRSVPFATSALLSKLHETRPDAAPLGWLLADIMLARLMRWRHVVPLFMAQAHGTAFRIDGGRGKLRPGDEGFDKAVCLALAHGAAEACRMAAEIARRADRLAEVTPKLRAKGASEAIRLLLNDDAVSGSLTTPKLSRFATRRLFERLTEFDAVRELSGRTSFRIYGL